MKIVAYNKCSLLDYHPYIAAVVFTPGCNMICAYCHNQALLHSHDYIEEDVIFRHLQHSKMLEAIVITGGEPTLQGQALIEFLRRVRSCFPVVSMSISESRNISDKDQDMTRPAPASASSWPGHQPDMPALQTSGLKIKLDTNGTNPKLLAQILEAGLVDYVAMDIKATPEKYVQICGLPFDRVKDSLYLLRAFGAYELRTTVYPEITLSELENLCQTYQADPYFLQQYRRIEANGLIPYDDDVLQRVAAKYQIPLRGISAATSRLRS